MHNKYGRMFRYSAIGREPVFADRGWAHRESIIVVAERWPYVSQYNGFRAIVKRT